VTNCHASKCYTYIPHGYEWKTVYYIEITVEGSARWIHIWIRAGTIISDTITNPISVVLSVVLMKFNIVYYLLVT